MSFHDLAKKGIIPNDHAVQANAHQRIHDFLDGHEESINRAMDFGCGSGSTVVELMEKYPSIEWIGLDIDESPEVRKRSSADPIFYSYDGTHIPFPDAHFDIVFSYQVLEHVRHPEIVLSEIQRILVPGGYFIGQTSQLEPYHSLSIWNFTAWGFYLLLEKAGFSLQELRPGIDAITLIFRRARRLKRFFSRYLVKESPGNSLINAIGWVKRKEPMRINEWKLLFCGQFIFLARKN